MQTFLKSLDTLVDAALNKYWASYLWYGFCVFYLNLAVLIFQSSSDNGFQLILYFLVAMGLTPVALGLPISMATVTSFRLWKLIGVWCGRNSTRREFISCHLKLSIFTAVEVSIWFHINQIGQDIRPILVIAEFIEEVPEIIWEAITKTVLSAFLLLLSLPVMFVIGLFVQSAYASRHGVRRTLSP
mmetsp:Transcript_17100/g.25907  ORF Transcript_17100/g.25907 Transcript_17100/m.25907 type:complete len:186 (+) Transcript_17100:100-657(+)